jgi:hypothetical protein
MRSPVDFARQPRETTGHFRAAVDAQADHLTTQTIDSILLGQQ